MSRMSQSMPVDVAYLERVTMEADYDRSWKEGKKNIAACSWLAYWHLERCSFVQARKFFGHLVMLDKSDSKAWLSLSVCSTIAGDVDEGERALQEAIRLLHRPLDDVRVRYCIALVAELRGNVNEAVAAYKTTIKMCEKGDAAFLTTKNDRRAKDVATAPRRHRKNPYQLKKYKARQVVSEVLFDIVQKVENQNSSKPEVQTADQIAATLISILVNAFKAKEGGREPNNEELQALFEELTEERIDRMLTNEAEEGTKVPIKSNPSGVATSTILWPLMEHQEPPAGSSSIYCGPESSELGSAMFFSEVKGDCLLRLAMLAHLDGNDDAANEYCDAVEAMQLTQEHESQSSSFEAGKDFVKEIGGGPLLDNIHPRTRVNMWVVRGMIVEDQKDYPAAEKMYRKALEINSEHYFALQRSGMIYMRYKDLNTEAAMCFGRAIEVNPTSAQCWYLLGRCYIASGQYEDARVCYSRSLNLDSNDENCWCSCGVVYYAYGMYKQALGFFSRALRINNEMCEAWYNVGVLYDICGQKGEADDAYEKARKYGLEQRLLYSGLTLDLPETASAIHRKKKRKGPHEVGQKIAAYHGDSTVVVGRRVQGLLQSAKETSS